MCWLNRFREMKMRRASPLILIIRFLIIASFIENGYGQLEKRNILITVKTTRKYEMTRLPIILDTWFTLAKEQIWFITDVGNTEEYRLYQNITNNHIIVTDCGMTHGLVDLCCKTNTEINMYYLDDNIEVKWLCLFDDDNYVNVPNLVKELRKYNHAEYWYLARQIYFKSKLTTDKTKKNGTRISFHFGTLGAGVCLSRALLIRMKLYLRNDDFVKLCQTTGYPDDVALGFLIGYTLGVNLTNVPTFHSHLDPLIYIPTDKLKYQVSLAYDRTNDHRIVNVSGFSFATDPTRFYSLHCHLGYCTSEIKKKFYTKQFKQRRQQRITTHRPRHNNKTQTWSKMFGGLFSFINKSHKYR